MDSSTVSWLSRCESIGTSRTENTRTESTGIVPYECCQCMNNTHGRKRVSSIVLCTWNNAIRHGYPDEGESRLTIRLHYPGCKLVMLEEKQDIVKKQAIGKPSKNCHWPPNWFNVNFGWDWQLFVGFWIDLLYERRVKCECQYDREATFFLPSTWYEKAHGLSHFVLIFNLYNMYIIIEILCHC